MSFLSRLLGHGRVSRAPVTHAPPPAPHRPSPADSLGRMHAAALPRPDYPATYRPCPADDRAKHPQVFEPALKQFSRAFRLGEPTFDTPETGRRWREARRRALDHVLKAVAGSPWKDHLVLRGSLLLKAWLGAEAREPGDMDWVVIPHTVKVADAWADEMFRGLTDAVLRHPGAGGLAFAADRVVVDDIWTYDRAPGRRIVFPWHADGLPPGLVQVDLVFGEQLWVPPEKLNVWPDDRTCHWVWTATKELSLAWKILWLQSDNYPQGKDLYDATLLAERTRLPFELLERAIDASGEPRWRPPLTPDLPMRWAVDWDNFKLEYPWVEGDAADWQARLFKALERTFTGRGTDGPGA